MLKKKENSFSLIQELKLYEKQQLKSKVQFKQGELSYRKEEFYIQNFIISPNQRFLAIFEKEKIVQKSHNQKVSQLRIIDISLNETLSIIKQVNMTNATFTFDSKYFILLTQFRVVTIIDINKQKTNFLEFKSDYLVSVDLDYNIYTIEKEKYIKKYSINTKTLVLYDQLFKLVYFQPILNYKIILKEYCLVMTQQYQYLLNLRNDKIVKQHINVYLIDKNQDIFIYNNFIQIKIIEISLIDISLKNIFSGKKIRRVINKQIINGNIFQNQKSIYFFGYQRDYDENNIIYFKLFDLIQGIDIELNYDLNIPFRDIYELFKMKDNFIVGVNKYEGIIRFFSLSSI